MPRGAEKITVSAVRTKSKRGRSMKQIIRFFSAVALMLSVGIFSCVAYGDIQLPDEYSVAAAPISARACFLRPRPHRRRANMSLR